MGKTLIPHGGGVHRDDESLLVPFALVTPKGTQGGKTTGPWATPSLNEGHI